MGSKVLVVGSLNADLVLSVSHFPAPGETLAAESLTTFPGGKGANQAFGAAKLGANVCLVGQVGDDNHGHWLRAALTGAGVDVSHVRVSPHVPTGTAIVYVDGAGQNQIVIVPGANGTFGPNELERQEDAFAGAKVVLLQLEIPIETGTAAARLAKLHGAVVVLDPTPARPLPDVLLSCVDYLTPNESELCLLTGASSTTSLSMLEAEKRARLLLSRGARKVLVKMAERGALLVSADGVRIFPALDVEALDSTAAGDAFNAGFAYGLARGLDQTRAIEIATAAGAFAVTRRGAQPSMPSLPELTSLLQKPLTSATTESVW